MKNVRITIDDKTLARVDEIAKPMGLNRSELVRRALREWLHRWSVESFEEEWINALHMAPDDAKRAKDWSAVQIWNNANRKNRWAKREGK